MHKGRRRADEVAVFEGMGLAIIELREERQLTQADLATKAELAPSSLRQIERGNVDAHWGTIRRLASALGLPLDALTELAEELAPGVGRAARREKAERQLTASVSEAA